MISPLTKNTAQLPLFLMCSSTNFLDQSLKSSPISPTSFLMAFSASSYGGIDSRTPLDTKIWIWSDIKWHILHIIYAILYKASFKSSLDYLYLIQFKYYANRCWHIFGNFWIFFSQRFSIHSWLNLQIQRAGSPWFSEVPWFIFLFLHPYFLKQYHWWLWFLFSCISR